MRWGGARDWLTHGALANPSGGFSRLFAVDRRAQGIHLGTASPRLGFAVRHGWCWSAALLVAVPHPGRASLQARNVLRSTEVPHANIPSSPAGST